MKLFNSIATTAVLGASFIAVSPAEARCGEGFQQLGTSNRCVPIDQNDFGRMKQYCTGQTHHYGQIALNNGRVDSLQ